MIVEAATPKDIQAIVSIFVANKDGLGLLQEGEAEVGRNLQDFLVAREADGKVIACSALHRDSAELAEIYGESGRSRPTLAPTNNPVYFDGCAEADMPSMMRQTPLLLRQVCMPRKATTSMLPSAWVYLAVTV